MACINLPIEGFAATHDGSWQVGAAPRREPETDGSCLRLLSPADPLTRLMMEADGVSEAFFDALLTKVTTALANRWSPRRADPEEAPAG
jgi:hypothetical protein